MPFEVKKKAPFDSHFKVDLVCFKKRAMGPFYSIQKEGAGLFPGDVRLALPHFP